MMVRVMVMVMMMMVMVLVMVVVMVIMVMVMMIVMVMVMVMMMMVMVMVMVMVIMRMRMMVMMMVMIIMMMVMILAVFNERVPPVESSHRGKWRLLQNFENTTSASARFLGRRRGARADDPDPLGPPEEVPPPGSDLTSISATMDLVPLPWTWGAAVELFGARLALVNFVR